jgi:hypothetical protein
MSTTLFKEVGYSLSNLIDNIEMGQIGLPCQRFPASHMHEYIQTRFK